MIHKVEGYKNGYVISNTKYAETNDEMFQKYSKNTENRLKVFVA